MSAIGPAEGPAIHPTAVISPEARLGEGVRVGPYSVVDAGAEIGDGTVLEAYVRVKGGTTLGARCHIFEHAVVGSEPQDHSYAGETSFVRIGDDVTLREHVTVNRATGEGNETVVGSGSLIMEGCHLGHNVRLGEHVTVTNMTGFSGHVEVGDYAVISGMSGFHQFVRVGAYAMVGGMARVIKDVPPYSLVEGQPVRIYGINVVGLRRRGFSQEERTKIKRIYKMIFADKALRADALAAVEAEYAGDPHAAVILDFFRSSKRGIADWNHGSRKRRAAEDGEE